MKKTKLLFTVCLCLLTLAPGILRAQRTIDGGSVAIEKRYGADTHSGTYWLRNRSGKRLGLLNGNYKIAYGEYYTVGKFEKGLPVGTLRSYTLDGGTLLREEDFDEQGRRHGAYRGFYPDGGRKVACEYSHGTLKGPYEEWYGNGNRKRYTDMRDGEYHGLSVAWNERGDTLSAWSYTDGLLDGPSLTWIYRDDGTDLNEVLYKDGTQVDTARFYRLEEDGTRTLKSMTVHDGEGKALRHEAFDGDTRIVMEYEEGKLRLIMQYMRGQLYATTGYDGDLLHGESLFYYPGTSRLWKRETYDRGRLIGREEYSLDVPEEERNEPRTDDPQSYHP